jgi:hypothetical protein
VQLAFFPALVTTRGLDNRGKPPRFQRGRAARTRRAREPVS